MGLITVILGVLICGHGNNNNNNNNNNNKKKKKKKKKTILDVMNSENL